MSDSCAIDSETNKSSANADARNVHRPVFDWILPGAKAMHNLQSRLSDGRVPDLLQRCRQLPVLGQL